jgi:hypothetical protein
MLINKDNSGKPIGFLETLVSAERVVTVNQAGNATTITSRDRASGQVKTETFFGSLPISKKD